jgi:hypothetical protein
MLHRIPVWNRHQSTIAGYWLRSRRSLRRGYWINIPIQVVAGVYCYYWYFQTPIPNRAVLAITLLSSAMVVVRMRWFHKVIYLVLILLFVKIENRAMVLDRIAFAQEQTLRTQQEDKNFQGIADNLKQSMLDNQTQFGKTLHGINEDTKIMVGGNTYPYLSMTMFITPTLFTEGKYPLHGVTMQINDFDEMGRRANTMLEDDSNPKAILHDTQFDVDIGELSPYHGIPIRGQPLLEGHKPRNLDIFFTAFNGQWQEHVCLKVATNSMMGVTLAGSYMVRSGTHKLKEWTDAMFPKKPDGTPDCHHVMPQDKPPKTAP